jgi:hypothetical protein
MLRTVSMTTSCPTYLFPMDFIVMDNCVWIFCLEDAIAEWIGCVLAAVVRYDADLSDTMIRR